MGFYPLIQSVDNLLTSILSVRGFGVVIKKGSTR